MLAFGPDGMLYMGLGDGGGGGDPHGNGQSTGTLLGKLLRIDVSGDAYTNPEDNPFAGGGGKAEIWAYGLRNPWRFSFDRLTGDLWIGDVGQNSREEIDFQAAGSQGGQNYGWNIWEGTRSFEPVADPPPTVAPVAEYGHEDGHCSVTGGYVYRGSAVPDLRGTYVYGDYCSGVVWGLRPAGDAWETRELLRAGARISSFGEDEAGELYLVDHGGALHRIVQG
jgi:glucose/arabinose dehydrogenase